MVYICTIVKQCSLYKLQVGLFCNTQKPVYTVAVTYGLEIFGLIKEAAGINWWIWCLVGTDSNFMIAVGTFMSPEGDIPVVINQIVQLNCVGSCMCSGASPHCTDGLLHSKLGIGSRRDVAPNLQIKVLMITPFISTAYYKLQYIHNSCFILQVRTSVVLLYIERILKKNNCWTITLQIWNGNCYISVCGQNAHREKIIGVGAGVTLGCVPHWRVSPPYSIGNGQNNVFS